MIKAKHYSYNILIAIAKRSTIHCIYNSQSQIYVYVYKNPRILLYFNGGNIFRINFLCHSIVDDKTCVCWGCRDCRVGPERSLAGTIGGKRGENGCNKDKIVHLLNCSAPLNGFIANKICKSCFISAEGISIINICALPPYMECVAPNVPLRFFSSYMQCQFN